MFCKKPALITQKTPYFGGEGRTVAGLEYDVERNGVSAFDIDAQNDPEQS